MPNRMNAENDVFSDWEIFAWNLIPIRSIGLSVGNTLR
jgi:hypothetical protein